MPGHLTHGVIQLPLPCTCFSAQTANYVGTVLPARDAERMYGDVRSFWSANLVRQCHPAPTVPIGANRTTTLYSDHSDHINVTTLRP